jgi:quercetin dioxygenase-like cupin family protein
VLAATLATTLITPAWAEEPARPAAKVSKLLESSTTADGKAVAYPAGTPQITVRIVELPPGGETGRHRHPIPLVAYILEGEVSVYDDGFPVHRYQAGESFVETTGWHNGVNEGSVPVRILATYLGITGASLAVKPEAK